MAGTLAGRPELAAMALGGWLGSLADNGGAYRTRARAIGIFLVGGSLAAAAATFVGGRPLLAVPLVFVVAFAGAMARVYGDAGSTLGTLISVTFCALLVAPNHDLRAALVRGEWLAAGTLLAAFLALVVWPVRPYAPARQAAARAFRALAAHAEAIRVAHASPTPDSAWLSLAHGGHARVRTALESLRTTLAETRARRPGASDRADQLFLLRDAAEHMFALLVATEAELAAGRTPLGAVAEPSLRELEATLLATARALEDLRGRRVPGDHGGPAAGAALDRAIVELWSAVERGEAIALSPRELEADVERPRISALAHLSRAAALVEETATLAQAATETTELVRSGLPPVVAAGSPHDRSMPAPHEPWWAPLRANIASDSIVLRHALRVGVTASFALALVEALGLGHGAWIVYTTIILLQPYVGATLERGTHRAVGTIAGGVVAAVIAASVHQPIAIAALMFPLSVAAVAVRTVNYGAFTFFLTPVFVLMAESGTGDWKLAGVRILNTLIGAALALIASRVLWPSWEHRRLSASLGEMLDSTRRYFRAVAAGAVGEPPTKEAALADLRRHMGLAANNAETAVERLAGEPRGRWGDVDALLSLMAHGRRLNGAVVALAQGGGVPATNAELARMAARVDETLREVIEAVRAERPPAAGPPAAGVPTRTGEFAAPGFVPIGGTPAALDDALTGAPLRAVARRADQLRAAAGRIWADG